MTDRRTTPEPTHLEPALAPERPSRVPIAFRLLARVPAGAVRRVLDGLRAFPPA
jgi:hypothetical protein